MHDFRSDTVTLPTPAMMAAISAARLGDSARGDDPTVLELEALACELTGKEDALLLPSGTMANLAAVIAHDSRGAEVIVDEDAHIYNSEGGGLSVIAAAVARPIKSVHGVMNPEIVLGAIKDADNSACAQTRLICLECTHNAAGGTVHPLQTMAAIHDVARQTGLMVHMDGARLFNAATYLKATILDLCRHVDSVTFSLCKGLGGPMGAILAGERGFMRNARRAARVLGGGMRQAGLIAAPAIVALNDDPYSMHERDHLRARRLAEGLAAIDKTFVFINQVQTNIVNCLVDDAAEITCALHRRGVLALSRGRKIRFVTHYAVDDTSVEAAINAFGEIVESLKVRP